MAMAQYYELNAAEGQEQALRAALEGLSAALAGQPGSLRRDLLVDEADCRCFVFIEYWETADAQKAAGAALGKDLFASIMATLAGPPVMRRFSAG
ncbi:MAG: putative quinol monooxygenase [Sphingobium sp.]|jgi:quinol monooxygenase YgiN